MTSRPTFAPKPRDLETPALALPRWPLGWYVVARSSEIPISAIKNVEIAARECVIFRSESGALTALDAHCPHMGAHLRHGKVIGDRIRCALHGYLIDRRGAVEYGTNKCSAARIWRVAERFGLVFLALGEHDPGPPPAPSNADSFAWTTARPTRIKTDWHSMMANGFDMQHLCTIHHRELVEPFQVGVEEKRVFLRYTSRVTGSSVSDRLMKWLSGDRIRVQMSCFGTIMFAETTLGKTSTVAVLGLLPDKNGLLAFGAFGIRPGPFTALRLWVTRLLFTAFLRRDFKIVEGMALRADSSDSGLRTLFDFLRQLPGQTP